MLVVVLADTRNLGPLSFIYDFRYGDKAGHFVLFGGLALFIDLAGFQLARTCTARLALRTSGALAIAVSLEEFSQVFFPSRSPDPFDLLAGFAGIALGTWLALKLAPLLRVEGADHARVELARRREG